MKSAAEPVPVLIVDADPAHRRLLAEHVSRGPERRFRALAYGSAAEAASHPAELAGGILLADLETVGGLEHLGVLGRGRPFIAMSARSSVATAVEVMRAGAIDFLPKPIGAKSLMARLEVALLEWKAGSRASQPPAAIQADFEGFVGRSAVMRGVYDLVERVASSRAPVFLSGESGTGKEVCAEAIHARAGTKGPFVALNCAAIPKDLVESEIFGHVRGAFTGALEDRTGAAELADGGTLFLDEIGEMPLPLQSKLLRFVQTGIVQRVGESRPRPVDTRLICATNRDPREEVAKGRFREDLFYRLNVLPMRLPPLRDRRQDIVPLAEFFLARYAAEERAAGMAFDAGATEFLVAQQWPGNVRQLQNLVRRIVVLHQAPVITAAILEDAMAEHDDPPDRGPKGPAAADGPLSYREQERRIIEAALAAHGGNISRAAAALGINPSTIYRKRQAWRGGS